MKFTFLKLAPVLLAALAPSAPAVAGGVDETAVLSTEWRNPSNSVHIRIDKCSGEKLCGIITWASPKAIADAKRGGTDTLVGTRLFRDLAPAGESKWKGKVFVPDIRKTFTGTIEFSDANTMTGKGCVLFGVVCKAQTWSRLR